MSGPSGEECETCYYFVPDGDVNGYGFCYRYPPKIHTTHIFLGDLRDEAGFPEPACNWNWCGEYKLMSGINDG